MKKQKTKKSIMLQNLKPISGGKAFIIKSNRHKTTETFSLIFYKPISKFEVTNENQ